MVCPYCGSQEVIRHRADVQLVELDFEAFIRHEAQNKSPEMEPALRCNGCGSEFRLGKDRQAGNCPFCGSSVVVPIQSDHRIPANGILPFMITAREARDKYREWIGSRFWAPNNLKKLAEQTSTLHPLYVPYWTYDSATFTNYAGARGDDYLDTETYIENGETRTRTVTKTHWTPVSGTVSVNFDDVLVMASTKVPRKYTDHMQTWGLGGLTDYQPEFLTGFEALRYDIGLDEGFDFAKQKMKPEIEQAIRWDIGGDRQTINWMETTYFNVTFKNVLLPIYTGAYRYSKRIWRFFINGQSGQVAGEAPISPWKVALAILLGLIVVGLFVWLYLQSNRQSY
jgi:DNA-directed RNA polymerase subunit RPC12/RpoP